MKTEYLKPNVRRYVIYVDTPFVQSATGSASGQNVTFDPDSDFDSFFGS